MKIFKIVPLLLIFALAGCLPDYKNPLTDPGEQKLDERLLGEWMKPGEMRNGKKTADIHYKFTVSDDKKFYHVHSWKIQNGVRKDNRGGMRIHTTELKGKHYMNIFPLAPKSDGKEKYYLIVKYTFAGNDNFDVNIGNISAVQNAVKNGKLSGKIPTYKNKEGKQVPSSFRVTVKSSSRKLRKFISRNDAEVYKGKGFLMLQRVK